MINVEIQPRAEVGSRRGARCSLCAEAPIDVITSEQLEASGYTELGRVLSKLIPGFNYPRPSITDGTDHAPPFTLRGLNPDQVLVLINGKRLVQSSLLHINGTIGRGSSGVDINSIPKRQGIVMKLIEQVVIRETMEGLIHILETQIQRI